MAVHDLCNSGSVDRLDKPAACWVCTTEGASGFLYADPSTLRLRSAQSGSGHCAPPYADSPFYADIHTNASPHANSPARADIHANDRADDYSSTAYWYQTLPHRRFPKFPKVADRLPRADATVLPVDLPIPPTGRRRSGSAVDPAMLPSRPGRRKTS